MKKRLPNKEFRKLVPKLREKEFYTPQEMRPINWVKYTSAQVNEAEFILSSIRDLVDSIHMVQPKRVGRPSTNPNELAKAVLASEFLQTTERTSEGWLRILSPYLMIKSRLDDRTIGRAYSNFEVLYILKQVFEKTRNSDGKLCGDGTGIETSRRQNYESEKKSGEYMTSIVDSREIVQAFQMSKSEKASMKEMIKEVKGVSIRLDAGFVDRKLTKEIAELGMKPYIFPKKNLKLNGSLAWKKMYLELYNSVQAWLIEYHQRSHSESFHSSFKRKNKIITKIDPASKLAQLTSRIIIHNLRKISYYSIRL